MHPSFGEAVFLAAFAFLAGTLDAIAGGGGLVTVPAIMTTQLQATPQLVLGTNKGQGIFGTTAALVRYWHAGLVDRKRVPGALAFGVVGALIGARLMLALDPKVLRPLVLVMLLAVAVFMTTRKGVEQRASPFSPQRQPTVAALIALVIGFYDGFFGPGTGTFLILAMVLLLGDSLPQATANAKVVNFASNVASVALFAWKGTIVWAYALPMAMAQVVGGLLGAHLAVRVGGALVRRTVLVVALVLMAKVALDLFGVPMPGSR